MNTLSWLIYIAATVPTLVQTLVILLMSLIFISVALIFGRGVAHDSNRSGYDKIYNTLKYEDAIDYFKNKRYMVHVKHIVWSVIALVFLQLVPTEKVFYMIAASEMGEMVVTSESGQEVFGELKDTIMYQLEQLQGEGEAQ